MCLVEREAGRVGEARGASAVAGVNHPSSIVATTPHVSHLLTIFLNQSIHRQLVKAATSHKVASLRLLADASEVMVKLEEMVYNTALAGSEREQLIHRVGHRLLLAMDRAEGVVRKFGHVSAMRKVFQSSQAAQGQFEDVKEEISKVSLVADAGGLASMKMMMSNSEAAPSSAGNGTGYVNGGVSMGQTSLGMSLDDEMSGLEQRGVQDGAREVTPMGLSMASLSAGGQSSMQAVADPGSAAQALPTDTGAPQAMGRAATLSGLQSRLSYNPPTARNAHSASMALSKTDGVSIVTDFTSLELFKGSKQAFLEAGTSVWCSLLTLSVTRSFCWYGWQDERSTLVDTRSII